jgi:organic radical activating enzyme
MIIAFYPGSGGNRYCLWRQGYRDFKKAVTYDHMLQSQEFVYRYLDSSTVGLDDQPLILTHCMNVPLIRKHFPEHDEVIVLLSDLDSSLRREWSLAGQHRDKDLPDLAESAYAQISYHYRYYKDIPVDITGATNVLDLRCDADEFSHSMREEINNIHSDVFDQALLKKSQSQHDTLSIAGDKVVDGFKSKFLDDAETMKNRLDAIGSSMCLAKWKQVSLHLTTGMNNSCYHPPLHHIPIESIKHNPSALHNTDYKKQQRQKMLNGERPEECSYCWAMEDNGKLSDRHYRSGESWAAKDFGKIVSSEWNDDITPSYVEVNFNSACNLKCSYCSPQFSSSWMDEVVRHGAFPTKVPHNSPAYFQGNRRPIPNREHNPYVDAFWSWWPDLYPELEHFRMTGGEPLMDKNTYRVFDYVLENYNPKLHLNVTSNFSVEESLWQKYLGYVKRLTNENRVEHFMQYVSVDAWGQQAEYIRNGLDFDLLWSRAELFLKEVPHRSSLTFIITMNNLSVTSLKQLLDGILDLRKKHSNKYQRIWFDTPVLRQPVWQSLQILPPEYAYTLEQIRTWMQQHSETEETRFKGFKDYEIQRLDRDIGWMKQSDITKQHRADFYKFFNEHDRRRGTNFLETFPEMKSWWEECKSYATRT